MNKVFINLIPFSKLRKKLKQKYFPKNFSMENMKHCLMVAPHPDDESLGGGGLLLKYADKFDCICMASSGVKTEFIGAEERAERRLKEFDEVMKAYGIRSHWIFKTFGVPPMIDQIKSYFEQYCQVLDTLKYDCIFLPHPQDSHEEHLYITNKLFKRILKRKGYQPNLKIVFYEVWRPIAKPTYFEDITAFVEKKKEILNLYVSQQSSVSVLPHIIGLNMYRGAFNHSKYAEAFRVCDVSRYLKGGE